MSLYLYLPFGHIFVRKNSKILHQYMNRECFPEEGIDIERLDPSSKEGKDGTMERKFKNQRSTRKTTTSWKTKSRKR